ncbi:MAG TPA: polysaccharide biosynthesis/export family protein [Pyrinomonadaceae bacterium]|nr:polysaccharide biosynthesis/export family protein [Pyrinomonadaceae bacterium]
MRTQIKFITILIVVLVSTTLFAQEGKQSSLPSVVQSQTVNSQGVKNYLLGPGDVIEIRIFGQSDLSTIAQVDSEGALSSLPFLEKPIIAKCRTEREVQKDIATAYKKLVNDPQVGVRIIERNSRQPAAVFGAVRQSTRVPTVRKIRLNELIAAAGGITERAAGTIQLLHTEPIMCPQPGEEADAAPIDGTRIPLRVVRIADMKSGKLESNPVIRPGDYVMVSEAELVYVTGSVVSPGSQLLTDKLTLSRVLAMSGGTRKDAKLSDVRIYRQRFGALQQEVLRVDYSAIKKNKQADVLLQPYDVIEVMEPGITVWGLVKGGLVGAFKSYPMFPRIP